MWYSGTLGAVFNLNSQSSRQACRHVAQTSGQEAPSKNLRSAYVFRCGEKIVCPRSRSVRSPTSVEAVGVARGCDPCWKGWSPATLQSTSGIQRVKKESSSKEVISRSWNRRPETACSNTGDTPMLPMLPFPSFHRQSLEMGPCVHRPKRFGRRPEGIFE